MSGSPFLAIIWPALLPMLLILVSGVVSRFGRPHFVKTTLPDKITIMKHAWPPFFSFGFIYVYGPIPGTSQMEEWLHIRFHQTYKRMLGFPVHQIESGEKIISSHPLSPNYHPDKSVFEKAETEFDEIKRRFNIDMMVQKHIAQMPE